MVCGNLRAAVLRLMEAISATWYSNLRLKQLTHRYCASIYLGWDAGLIRMMIIRSILIFKWAWINVLLVLGNCGGIIADLFKILDIRVCLIVVALLAKVLSGWDVSIRGLLTHLHSRIWYSIDCRYFRLWVSGRVQCFLWVLWLLRIGFKGISVHF